MIESTHQAYDGPGPCSCRHSSDGGMEASDARVKAICCVRTLSVDDRTYNIPTLTPRLYCANCCPVCGKAKGAAA